MAFDYAAPFQEAVYTRLASNTDLSDSLTGIYDAPPDSAHLPYITFGKTTSNFNDTKSFRGVSTSFEIVAWSKGPGQMEVKNIMALIDKSLHGTNLAVSGIDVVSLRLESSVVERQPATDTRPVRMRGVMTFRALLFEAVAAL